MLRAPQRGISLVELLAGVTIGMIGSLIIFQVLLNADSRRRTTAAASDVQVTGSVGLYNIDRDLKQAAYNFGRGTAGYLGCEVRAYDAARVAGDPNFPGPEFRFRFAPLWLMPAAAGRSLAVEILIGGSPVMTEPLPFTLSAASTKTLQNRVGFEPSDFVVALQNPLAPQCELARVAAVPAALPNVIDHGTLGSDATSGIAYARFNRGIPQVAFGNTGVVVNLGRRPRLASYFVQDGRLWIENRIGETFTRTEIADGAVELIAQYGIDTSGDRAVQPSEWTTTAPANSTGWQNLLSVRVALLMRSGQYERPATPGNPVTQAAPEWMGGTFTMTNLDGSGGTPSDPAQDWRNYRYRVYQTTVTLRNAMWGGL